MFEGKRVFVSGGNGVIGNELVKLLHADGAKVLVGDLKPRPADWPKEILYRQGDLNYITKRELDNFSPEVFFHLAATFERSTETYGFWEENFAHNVNLSHHLMTLLKDSPALKKVVFASSYLIYNKELYNFEKPVAQPCTLKESDPISPRNLTGAAKLSHEVELNFLKEFKGSSLQVVCARIYRSYGFNSRDIISRWVRALLKGETLEVFNKENIFDYIFAGDVAEGLLRLAKSDFDGVVNLGTGTSRSISEVIDVLRAYFPQMVTKDFDQKILYEASQADTTLLEQVTGWKPSKTIEDVIPKLIEFEKSGSHLDAAPQFNVLVTSGSKKVGLIKAVKAAMRKAGNSGDLYCGDIDEYALGRYFADKFWKMPPTVPANTPEITRYCTENGIKLIFPSRDGELEFWAEQKGALASQGVHVMVSDPAAVNSCLDKLAFYHVGKSHDLPVIETHESLSSLTAERLVVKERFGAGSKSIGLDLDRAAAAEHAKSLSCPIFQPYIEGKEYSADLYISQTGIVKGVVVRERNTVVTGESQVTTTVSHRRIESLCKEVAAKLKLSGHAILQLLVDAQDAIHVIECNPRFGGASTAAIAAGLDSFYWQLLEASGQDISEYPFARIEGEIKQIRYPEDLIVEA